MNEFDRSLTDKFWSRVQKTDTCWLWTGGATRQGYGAFYLADGSQMLSHRFSYELVHGVGSLPRGRGTKVLRHRCDIRRCVHPEHLVLGTYKENSQDAAVRGRMHPGEKHGNARLTRDAVRKIRKLREEGVSPSAVAEQFGVDRRYVGQLERRERWAHI